MEARRGGHSLVNAPLFTNLNLPISFKNPVPVKVPKPVSCVVAEPLLQLPVRGLERKTLALVFTFCVHGDLNGLQTDRPEAAGLPYIRQTYKVKVEHLKLSTGLPCVRHTYDAAQSEPSAPSSYF